MKEVFKLTRDRLLTSKRVSKVISGSISADHISISDKELTLNIKSYEYDNIHKLVYEVNLCIPFTYQCSYKAASKDNIIKIKEDKTL